MRLLKRIYKNICVAIKQIKLNVEFQTLKREDVSITAKKINLASKNILILAPHADDELIGCHGIISNATNVSIYYFGFGGATNIQLEIRRKTELDNYLKDKNCHLLTLVDTYINDIKRLMSEGNYDSVFLPSFFDWHEDHILVSEIFMKVTELIRTSNSLKIFMYTVSVPIPDCLVNTYSDLSNGLSSSKWREFKAIYYSQNHMPLYRFVLQERLNGSYLGKYAVESYSSLSLVCWEDLFMKFQKMNKEKKQIIQQDIYSIRKIRERVNMIYKEMNQ